MGLDLRLLPIAFNQLNHTHTMLSMHRDQKLFDLILDLETQKGNVSAEGVTCFLDIISKEESEYLEGEYKYGTITHSPGAGGDSIKWVYSLDLVGVLDKHLYDSRDIENLAAREYIRMLPDTSKVFLYWH